MKQFFISGVLVTVLMIAFVWSSGAQEQKQQESPFKIPQPGNIQMVTTTNGSIYIGRITEIAGVGEYIGRSSRNQNAG